MHIPRVAFDFFSAAVFFVLYLWVRDSNKGFGKTLLMFSVGSLLWAFFELFI